MSEIKQPVRPVSATTPETPSPLLTVQNLTFSYDEAPVLRQVGLQVNAGEWVGVIGPNGSGKSTLIKLMGGLLQSPPGTVHFGARDVRLYSKPELARRIAWIPQEAATPFSFTAFEMVMMGRHPFLKPFQFEGPEDFELCHRAMETTSTLKFKTRRFSELSGGEKQRVLIAGAIVQSPELLLLDEPTSSLDLKYQVQVLELLDRLNLQRGITLVLAIHDLNLAARYCHRLVLLKDGKVVRDGSPESVLQKETLEEVYEIKIQLVTPPGGGHPLIFPEA